MYLKAIDDLTVLGFIHENFSLRLIHWGAVCALEVSCCSDAKSMQSSNVFKEGTDYGTWTGIK